MFFDWFKLNSAAVPTTTPATRPTAVSIPGTTEPPAAPIAADAIIVAPVSSCYVGNIFGAPLAFEALLAFFLESTFLGLWIFGWDRLSPVLHNLTIWCVAAGTNISALFILAANSWMQHPVGAVVNP